MGDVNKLGAKRHAGYFNAKGLPLSGPSELIPTYESKGGGKKKATEKEYICPVQVKW